MSITITDPVLLDQFRNTREVTELLDPEGNVVAVFLPLDAVVLPARLKHLFTTRQREAIRTNAGRPIAEVLRELDPRA